MEFRLVREGSKAMECGDKLRIKWRDGTSEEPW